MRLVFRANEAVGFVAQLAKSFGSGLQDVEKWKVLATFATSNRRKHEQ